MGERFIEVKGEGFVKPPEGVRDEQDYKEYLEEKAAREAEAAQAEEKFEAAKAKRLAEVEKEIGTYAERRRNGTLPEGVRDEQDFQEYAEEKRAKAIEAMRRNSAEATGKKVLEASKEKSPEQTQTEQTKRILEQQREIDERNAETKAALENARVEEISAEPVEEAPVKEETPREEAPVEEVVEETETKEASVEEAHEEEAAPKNPEKVNIEELEGRYGFGKRRRRSNPFTPSTKDEGEVFGSFIIPEGVKLEGKEKVEPKAESKDDLFSPVEEMPTEDEISDAVAEMAGETETEPESEEDEADAIVEETSAEIGKDVERMIEEGASEEEVHEKLAEEVERKIEASPKAKGRLKKIATRALVLLLAASIGVGGFFGYRSLKNRNKSEDGGGQRAEIVFEDQNSDRDRVNLVDGDEDALLGGARLEYETSTPTPEAATVTVATPTPEASFVPSEQAEEESQAETYGEFTSNGFVHTKNGEVERFVYSGGYHPETDPYNTKFQIDSRTKEDGFENDTAYGLHIEGETDAERTANWMKVVMLSPEALVRLRVQMGVDNLDSIEAENLTADQVRAMSQEEYDRFANETADIFYTRLEGGEIRSSYNWTLGNYMRDQVMGEHENSEVHGRLESDDESGEGRDLLLTFFDAEGKNIVSSQQGFQNTVRDAHAEGRNIGQRAWINVDEGGNWKWKAGSTATATPEPEVTPTPTPEVTPTPTPEVTPTPTPEVTPTPTPEVTPTPTPEVTPTPTPEVTPTPTPEVTPTPTPEVTPTPEPTPTPTPEVTPTPEPETPAPKDEESEKQVVQDFEDQGAAGIVTVEPEVSAEDLTERPTREEQPVVTEAPETNETGTISATGPGLSETEPAQTEPENRTNDENAFVQPEEVTRDEQTGVPEVSGGAEADQAQEQANAQEITEAPTQAEGDAYIDDLLGDLGL